MTFKKYLLYVLIYSLSMNCTTVFAAASTDHSYDRFCATEAKIKFDALNKLTDKDVTKIKELKSKINDLEARKVILNGLKKIRDEYLKELDAIASTDYTKSKEKIKLQEIENFRKLLKNTLTLNAISLLLEDSSTPGIQKIENLCKEDRNLDLSFCKNYNKKEVNWFAKIFPDGSKDAINKTLENFSTSMEQINDPSKFKEEIRKIYKSIPEDLNPTEILEILSDKAPRLISITLSSNDKNEIKECINDNSKCKNLISNENVTSLLTAESRSTYSAISEKFNKTRKEVDLIHKEDLGKILQSYKDPKIDNEDEVRKNINQKMALVLEHMKNKNNANVVGFNEADLADFAKECTISDETKGKAFDEQVKKCNENAKTLAAKINDAEKKQDEETNKLKKELNETIDNNINLERIEKLKHYIAQRYARSCPEKEKLRSNILDIKSCTKDHVETGSQSIYELSRSIDSVLETMKKANTVTKTRGELGDFSKNEMLFYNKVCQEIPNPQNVGIIHEICKDIKTEQLRISKLKDSNDWEKLHKDNYIQYNPRSKKGYDVIPKKSNARIIGEALVPSLNNIIPVWYNYAMMGNQIDWMTNQALLTKQQNYMNSIDSPWAIYNPNFQGMFYNTSIPFTGFQNTIGTPTTNVTGGFNFSP